MPSFVVELRVCIIVSMSAFRVESGCSDVLILRTFSGEEYPNPSVSPEIPESVSRQFRVSNRVLDIPVTQVVLD